MINIDLGICTNYTLMSKFRHEKLHFNVPFIWRYINILISAIQQSNKNILVLF